MHGIYLALGDSLTTGYGVGLNCSFATLYYSTLLSCFPNLGYENLGVNGLTSGQLVAMVEQPHVQRLILQARVITVTIGSNDLLALGKGLALGQWVNPELTLRDFQQNLMLLGDKIRRVNSLTMLKIASIYNPLPPMDKQTNLFAYTLLKQANHSVTQMARQCGGVVVPVAKAFSGQEMLLLSSDHIHPNLAGHQVMAELFARY
ncbi:SGNH/GDSL hydrolase family protein [Desulfitobacterium hafniense]|nr:GDSL-type esterase/lipase family protein [Desulfitobacterium hafniense]ACL22294.1 lipolytic protein G-D-S-L family [Desulfitobacterium hafniense DCB-2]EHL04481.1 GDSL-like protein [Desulfitobacterium hafniense DP7]